MLMRIMSDYKQQFFVSCGSWLCFQRPDGPLPTFSNPLPLPCAPIKPDTHTHRKDKLFTANQQRQRPALSRAAPRRQ